MESAAEVPDPEEEEEAEDAEDTDEEEGEGDGAFRFFPAVAFATLLDFDGLADSSSDSSEEDPDSSSSLSSSLSYSSSLSSSSSLLTSSSSLTSASTSKKPPTGSISDLSLSSSSRVVDALRGTDSGTALDLTMTLATFLGLRTGLTFGEGVETFVEAEEDDALDEAEDLDDLEEDDEEEDEEGDDAEDFEDLEEDHEASDSDPESDELSSSSFFAATFLTTSAEKAFSCVSTRKLVQLTLSAYTWPCYLLRRLGFSIALLVRALIALVSLRSVNVLAHSTLDNEISSSRCLRVFPSRYKLYCVAITRRRRLLAERFD